MPRRAWRWLHTPYALLDEAAQRHGHTFRLALPGMGSALLSGQGDVIRAMAANKDLIGGRGTRALRPILGEASLIVSEGEAHARQRRCIAPLFADEAAASMDERTRALTRAAIDALPRHTPFRMQDCIRAISLRIIIQVLFGPLSETRERELSQRVEAFLHSFKHPTVLFIKALHWDLGPRSPWGRFVRNKAALQAFIMQEIQARQHSETMPPGVLSDLLMLQSQGQFGSNVHTVLEEIVSLLLFGHDTAAATLAWVFYHLHAQPAHAQAVREALRAQQPSSALLSASIKESQRLCPVVVHLTRVARCTTQVGDYLVQEGEHVLPCTYLAHRDPAVFEDPSHYRPQRFLTATPPSSAFFPFGYGVRKCVGAPFAQRQLELILGEFMRHGVLDPINPEAIHPVRDLLLIVPSDGMPMRLRERLS